MDRVDRCLFGKRTVFEAGSSSDEGTDTCLFPGPKRNPASNAPLRRDGTCPCLTNLRCIPPSSPRVPPFRPGRTCPLSCVLIGPFENRGRRTAVRKASNRPQPYPFSPPQRIVRQSVRLSGRPVFSLVQIGASHVRGAEGSFPLLIDIFSTQSRSFIDTFAHHLVLRDVCSFFLPSLDPFCFHLRSVWT